MKHLKIISLLSAFLLLGPIALAQTGDWQTVQHLPGGTMLKITLKQGRTFGHCEFMGATDHALRCDYPGLQYIRAQYPRDNVKAVYLVHNTRAIGVGIGAGAGAVIGAARDPVPGLGRGGTTLFDAAILGGLGYFFGMVADPFFHGKAVYRSPNAPNDAHHPSTKNQHTPNEPADNLPCVKDGKTLQCVDP